MKKAHAGIALEHIEPKLVGATIFDFNKKHEDVIKTISEALFQLSTMLSDSQLNNNEIQAIWDIFIAQPACSLD